MLRHLGKLEHATEQLRTLDVATLEPHDRVLYYREEGAILYTRGRLQAAVHSLERAWFASFTLPLRLRPSLRAGVAHPLALALHTQGHSESALRYLTAALCEAVSDLRRAYLHSTSGLVNTYLARFEKAESEFQAALLLASDVPALLPVLTYNRALLARVTRKINEALALLDESIGLAEGCGESETACYALLTKCSIHTAQGHYGLARAALERAKILAVPGKAFHLTQLREGALLAAERRSDGVMFLKRAIAGFRQLGLTRESTWGYLRLAHASLLLNQPHHVSTYLTEAVHGQFALATAAPLFGEITEMQELLDYLAALDTTSYTKHLYTEYRGHVSRKPRKLTLLSLPSQGMLLDGEPILLGFKYAVPILVYLLICGPTTIERLTADVLAHKTPQGARNYFHQVRYRIHCLLPSVSIPYQADYKYYIQQTGMTIECDYLLAYSLASQGLEGLQQALDLYEGPFLTDLEGEWVEHARERLRSKLLTAGWRELSKPKAGQNPQSIELAWRLLAIDPGNVELGQVLLDLQRELEGDGPAHNVLGRLQRHYTRVLDEVPAELK